MQGLFVEDRCPGQFPPHLSEKDVSFSVNYFNPLSSTPAAVKSRVYQGLSSGALLGVGGQLLRTLAALLGSGLRNKRSITNNNRRPCKSWTSPAPMALQLVR